MNVKHYEGKRVYFRPLELSDGPKLVAWVNDPANWKTLGRHQPINQVREREWLEGLYRSTTDIVFGVVLARTNQLIGCAGLHNIAPAARSATFGVMIGERRYQGQGLGQEITALMARYAFEELNLNRVELTVFAENERGIRAYRRAGFVQEGRQRQAMYRNGRYHDALIFGLLREEWEDERRDAVAGARLSSMMT